MTDPTPTRDEAWRYSINYGPDGEENFANVYAADGQFVGNLRTHHAIAICNAFAVCEKLASAPAPASGGVVAVAVKPTVEQIARAICRGRDLNPDCQNQGAARDGTVDGNWPEPRENFGRPYDTRWHYGWRNQAKAAQAVLELLASLSPAATPVSEAGGEAEKSVGTADLATLQANAIKAAYWFADVAQREAHRHSRSTFYEAADQAMIAAIQRLALAKPASSPAGGDVVREALEAYHDAYSDRRFAPEGSHEAYDAAARLEDAHDLASRALSQSTSAGRVGE